MPTASSPALVEAQQARARRPGCCTFPRDSLCPDSQQPGVPRSNVREAEQAPSTQPGHDQPRHPQSQPALETEETHKPHLRPDRELRQPAPRVVPVCKYPSKEKCRDATICSPESTQLGGFVFRCTWVITGTRRMPDSKHLHPYACGFNVHLKILRR